MVLTDTHCHLYKMRREPEEVLAACRKAGVARMLIPAISYEDNERILSACRYEGCGAALGIHPKYTGYQKALGAPRGGKDRCLPWKARLTRLREEEDLAGRRRAFLEDLLEKCGRIERMAREDPFAAAIGETGLDYSYPSDEGEKEIQAALFHRQIQTALRTGLPLVLHIRPSERDGQVYRDALAILEAYRGAPGLKGVLHCLTMQNMAPEEADRFLSLGFKLGIGGSLTRSPDGRLEDMVRRAPAEAVLLETDAPWVRPSFEGGEPEDGENDPAVTIPHILALVSRIRGTDEEEMAEIIEENADSLFPRMKKTDTDGTGG